MSKNVTLYICGYENCKLSSTQKSTVQDHTVYHVEANDDATPGNFFCSICKYCAKSTLPNTHNKASHPTVAK
jgi:hypothetical protein